MAGSVMDATVIAILVSSVIGLLVGEIIEDVDIINIILEDSDD